MEVLNTVDYSIFKSLTSNREVDPRHVKRLVQSISKKNLLKIKPIIVNDSLELIDGQHRLEAAKQLDVPIYYVISGAVNKNDISDLNSVQKNWKPEDYLNYYTIEGREEYKELSKFINKYPLINISTAVALMNAYYDGKNITKDFRNGILNISNKDQAYDIADQLSSLRSLGVEFAFTRNFVKAIRLVNQIEEFDFEVFKVKLLVNLRGFVPCINTKQYLEMIEEYYNYRSSKNVINTKSLNKK